MKYISRRKNISRSHKTKRRMKKYTKVAKRLARLNRRTRRIRRSRIRRRNIRGGEGTGNGTGTGTGNGTVVKGLDGSISYGAAGTVATIPTMSQVGGDNASIIADNQAAGNDQNAGNNLLKGGSYKKKYNKQRGGDGCSGNVLSLYAYNPPAGMMGPVPQPSTDAASNNLILQAANISVNSQSNSEFDSRVNNVS
jgi:hypothetical protein